MDVPRPTVSVSGQQAVCFHAEWPRQLSSVILYQFFLGFLLPLPLIILVSSDHDTPLSCPAFGLLRSEDHVCIVCK